MISLGQPRPAAAPVAPPRNDWYWLVGFVVVEVVFQVGLFLLGNTALRMPLRIGVFGASLSYLLLVRPRPGDQPHPAARLMQFIVGILALNILNPAGAGLLAGLAQSSLYVAVLAPLVWVSRLRVNFAMFRYVVLILWAFHTASAVMGALQVKYPGRFDGALANVIDKSFYDAMLIKTADGTMMLRPKGLTDSPGGAGVSSVYAIILGMGLLLTERSMLWKAAAIGGMGVSVFGIFLSQGRTNIVLPGAAAIALLAVLMLRGDRKRATFLATTLTAAAIVGTSVAFAVGGQGTVDRFATLLEENPGTVAYQNRGQFIDQLVGTDMWVYPLGAGGGRWGMINGYFGDMSRSLYAEMQWQALLYDGGIPLILLYIVLLGMLLNKAWIIARTTSDPSLACWAGVLVGYNIASIAASFVFPVYIKDTGLEMILLNACLLGVVSYRRARAPVPLPAMHMPRRAVLAGVGRSS